MESNAYVCKYNEEMDMVFNKNIKRKQIEEFENDNLEKVSISPMLAYLKEKLI